MCFKYWEQPTLVEWILFISTGVFGYFGQLYMTKAFQMDSVSRIAPIKYMEVIFTVIIGAILFNEIYTIWSLLGIGMIVLGLILNLVFKNSS